MTLADIIKREGDFTECIKLLLAAGAEVPVMVARDRSETDNTEYTIFQRFTDDSQFGRVKVLAQAERWTASACARTLTRPN